MTRKPDCVVVTFKSGLSVRKDECSVRNWAKENCFRRSYAGDGGWIATAVLRVFLKPSAQEKRE